MTNAQLLDACCKVERVLRSLGPDCQVMLTKDGAEVAPVSWAGSSTGATLYRAVQDALKATQQSLDELE